MMIISIILMIVGTILAVCAIHFAATFFGKIDSKNYHLVIAAVSAILSIAVFGYSSYKYNDTKYSEIEKYVEEDNYEVYIDGSKVDSQNIDIRNYKLNSIKIDNDIKKIFITVQSSDTSTNYYPVIIPTT